MQQLAVIFLFQSCSSYSVLCTYNIYLYVLTNFMSGYETNTNFMILFELDEFCDVYINWILTGIKVNVINMVFTQFFDSL